MVGVEVGRGEVLCLPWEGSLSPMLQPSLPGPTLKSDQDGRPTHGAAAGPSETPPWRQPLSPHTSAMLPNTEEMSGLGTKGKPPFACPALGHQMKALSLRHGEFVEWKEKRREDQTLI